MKKYDTWLKKIGLKEKHVHMGMFDFGINVVIGDYEGLTPYIQFKFDDKEFNTDAFECLHTMYHVQRWAGFPLGDETEEVMAHGMAHIINAVLSK